MVLPSSGRRELPSSSVGHSMEMSTDTPGITSRSPRRSRCPSLMRLAGAILASSLLACCTGSKVSPVGITGNGSAAREAQPGPPEGAILLSTGARLVGNGAGTDVPHAGLVGYDISPDGGTLVATTEERLATGISYSSELVLIDAGTAAETVLAHAASREEFNGPIKWSPDGTRIAYSFVRYRTNPAVVHPGSHPELLTVCVLVLRTASPTCYPGLGTVFDFDWSPDGQSLAVTGPGPQPLQLVDISTGRSSTLVSLDDPELRRALEGRAVQFTSPAWSSSASYVAAWINATPGGSVPVVFGLDGHLVARGRAATHDPRKLVWMPDRDALLYTPGVTNERTAYLKLYELDPATSEERLFLRQNSPPQITDFALSPSGRWLAVFRWRSYAKQGVHFVDLAGDEKAENIRVSSEGSFADWGPGGTR
jgi:Tol biopolymer transport system component